MNLKRVFLAAALVVCVVGFVAGQSSSNADALKRGIELFADGRYTEALPLFDTLFMDPGAGAYRAEGAYWAAMAHIATGDAKSADKAIDTFLTSFPGHERSAELVYQRGRLAFLLKDYERAVQVLASYVSSYPKGEYLSAAIFWSAESLYALGRIPDAEKLYRTVVERYPESVKAEAARYRLALVQFKYREDELLTLLKWSHEESLRIIEEFQRREKAYEQALAVYQKRYGEAQMGTVAAQTTLEEQIAALKRSMDDMASRLQEKDVRVAELEAALSSASSEPSTATAMAGPVGADAELLAMKEQTLSLIEFYLEKLSGDKAAEGTK